MSAREIKRANTQDRTADDGSTRGVWLTVPRPGRSSNSVCHRIRTVRTETGRATLHAYPPSSRERRLSPLSFHKHVLLSDGVAYIVAGHPRDIGHRVGGRVAYFSSSVDSLDTSTVSPRASPSDYCTCYCRTTAQCLDNSTTYSTVIRQRPPLVMTLKRPV